MPLSIVPSMNSLMPATCHSRPRRPWRSMSSATWRSSSSGRRHGAMRRRSGSSSASSRLRYSSSASPSQSMTWPPVSPTAAMSSNRSRKRARRWSKPGCGMTAWTSATAASSNSMPGRPAMVVADDLGVCVEPPRPVDACAAQRLVAGERGMTVEQAQEHRPVPRHCGQGGVVNGRVAETVRVETPADQPAVVARRGVGKRSADFVEGLEAGEIDAVGERQREHRVGVRVGQPGRDESAIELDHL